MEPPIRNPNSSSTRKLIKDSNLYVYDIYEPGEVLGEGMSGTVRKGTHIGTRKEYAIKVIYKDRCTEMEWVKIKEFVHIMQTI